MLIVGAFEITFFFSDTAPTLALACFNAVAVAIGELISCTVLGVALVKLIESNESLKRFLQKNKNEVTSMRPELILWDWNGTLLDDVDLCVDALNRLLADFGYPQRYDRDQYRAIFWFSHRGILYPRRV